MQNSSTIKILLSQKSAMSTVFKSPMFLVFSLASLQLVPLSECAFFGSKTELPKKCRNEFLKKGPKAANNAVFEVMHGVNGSLAPADSRLHVFL